MHVLRGFVNEFKEEIREGETSPNDMPELLPAAVTPSIPTRNSSTGTDEAMVNEESPDRSGMIRVGIVGLGYWGPNLVRCFSDLENCKVTAVCDQSYDQLLRIKDRFPGVYPIADFDQLLDRDLVDAVVIATPTATHCDLAMMALEHDLHVFVEKPLARTSEECRRMIQLASERDRTLFVGTFSYSSATVRRAA